MADIMNRDRIDLDAPPKISFWKLARPMIALSVFSEIYSLVDMFWVSQMNATAFFAIGVCVPLISLINSFGTSVGYGTNSVISRYIGLGKFEDTYNFLLHGIIGAGVLWLVICFSTFFLKDILYLMNVTEATDLAISYLTPMFLCSFLFLFGVLFAQTLQAEGNSNLPTVLGISANVLNLILDPILIFHLNLGIVGAAYATIISAIIPVIVYLYWYISGRSVLILTWRYFKPGISIEILTVALPSFLMDSTFCIFSMFINKVLIQQLAHVGVLLYSTANKIASVLLAPDKAYGLATASIGGHLYGAGKIDKLKELYSYSYKISVITGFVLALAFFFVREWGYALFSVTNMSESIFYIALAGILLVPAMGSLKVSSLTLIGIGKSYWALICGILEVICQVILILALYSAFPYGACVLITLFVTGIVTAILVYIFINWQFNKFAKDPNLNPS